ncbi:MAG: hypothetical protein AAGA56_23695 [Myxococcota bacterium]
MMRRLRSGFTALCMGVTASSIAAAQTQPDPCFPRDRLSSCLAADNFWPRGGSGDFLTVADTRRREGQAFTLGVVPSFISRPIGLTVASPDPEGTTIYAVESALTTNFVSSYAVIDGLVMNAALPVVLYQDGAGKDDVVGGDQGLPTSSLGDFRLGVHYAFLDRAPGRDGLGVAARFDFSVPTADQRAFAGYSSVAFVPGVALDYRWDRLQVGVDISARIRDVVEIAGAAIGTQVGTNFGIGVEALDPWLRFTGELWALYGVFEQQALIAEPGERTADLDSIDEPHIPLEWMVAAHTDGLWERRLRFSFGGGTIIPTSEFTPVTTPLYRLTLAARYVHDGW